MQGLVCSNISKRYETGKVALNKLSMSVESKGIFALIGRNGAGKTTLIRILATQLSPTSGAASLNGVDIIKDPHGIRERIAIVPQEARATPWLTPHETIFSYLLWRGFDTGEAHERADRAIKRLAIEEYADKSNRFLSGGIKRKVLVATVIASEAELIFLDEPTTGLDPISRNDLWNVLNELKKDRFIFLTTHYLEEAERLADNIGIIENGKLLGIGTLEELRKKVKYPYSIKMLDAGKKAAVRPKSGKVIRGLDGNSQILTSQKEAYAISDQFIKKGIKFSMNPISLDDIFYYLVKKPIENGEEHEEEYW
ncbi:MAG: ABC transporter ATP-binding protein [Candidatus Micrarchaeota archaeon]|nr:ABC transporter ATP-binding protein [Candidatus Micrarchaeota archaeon]MDE1850024.1 ABC transporter ATP-binding protein [Candidatus Micrarchaeota archaeon]